MKKGNKKNRPHTIHLPGFLTENEIGLGNVIKSATFAIGIKLCGGCEKRAATLNSWLVFRSKKQLSPFEKNNQS